MNAPTVRTRFAPSPTGSLHLGNVRTALFNRLWARHAGGVFLLRVEDTDAQRSADHHTAALLDDLRWLGIDWQEGPGAGGSQGPYEQSRRRGVYDRQLQRLEHSGQVYPCFCSAQELELSRKAQRAAGRAPRYAGTCARLSESQRAERVARGVEPAVRFRVPPGRELVFDDLVRGAQRFLTDDIGDFIIRRADGAPQFFFANAVDDALMDVTHVLRGEDHLSNTPRQLLLLEALDLPVPRYGHLGMILGDDGQPLSKRNGSLSVAELREAGYRPEAVLNYLVRLGHSYADDDWRTPEALVQGFEPARLSRAPARFDRSHLDFWQGEAVRRMDNAALARWLAPAVQHRVPREGFGSFLEAVRPNVKFPGDAAFWAGRLSGPPPQPSAEAAAVIAEAGPAFFAAAAQAVAAGIGYAELVATVRQRTGLRGRALFMPLRAALTGEVHGPELAAVFSLLGPEQARIRLRAHC